MSLNRTSTPGHIFVGGAAAAADSEHLSYLYPHHSPAVATFLIATAQALVDPRGKGIYATDETIDGIEARMLPAEGLEGKSKTRFRLVCMSQYGSHPSTVFNMENPRLYFGRHLVPRTVHRLQLALVLTNRAIFPGVRADTDAYPLPVSPLEPVTQGLDDLLPRLQAAYRAGARFTKWRLPTQAALEVQAESLTRFSAISQQASLVPIVEPDVDFVEDANLKRSVEVHVKIIRMIYALCVAYGGLIETTSVKAHGLATATALARSVPVAVFLSGGLWDSDSVKYLNAVNAIMNKAPAGSPLSLSKLLSLGRGLQGDAMCKWVEGDEEAAKQTFEAMEKACSLAARGEA